MGRDLLAKLGITLNSHKQQGKQSLQIFRSKRRKVDISKISEPTYNTRSLKKSHNSINIQKNYSPSQHKARKVPLHLLEKIENDL